MAFEDRKYIIIPAAEISQNFNALRGRFGI